MNIVILHRIPFARVRYDMAIDHEEHTVRYLGAAGGFDGVPTPSEHRVLEGPTSDTRALAKQHADWLGEADRLIARSEYDLLPAALLREEFGIPGDLPDAVLPVRDKWLMRTLAADAGVPQPSFWSAEEFRRDAPGEGTYLVKPRLEASSSGIELGGTERILAVLDGVEDPEGVFVEEFVPGEIWHLDGYVQSGEFGPVVCSAYVGDCLSFAFGSPLGSAQRPDEPGALSLLRRTLAALGQSDGCFHFEAIRAQDGRFLFLETASRVGGAGVADTFELRTGINLYQADLRHQLGGLPPDSLPELSSDYYGWFVYPAHHSAERTVLDFDPALYAGRLRSFIQNASPASRPGQITYATGATPLSGIAQGTATGVRTTLEEIFARTAVLEQR
ncbi:acetyl-CoA carboxylase biotin carboxylase subunit family protein [Streptomyces sp. NPDC021093]|uniref:acetyl-CoA carboxylase biotin carboxylase subunit family protein n=1 Tax=Streptomyces sp. NPDC021093 TaxID=3365112 RepID=UPI0037AD683D